MRSVRALPKAHLHLHIEGSARRETILEFAKRYDARVTRESLLDIGSTFDAFVKCYYQAVSVIRTPEDLTRVCEELVIDEATEGVLYSEPMIDPGSYCEVLDCSYEDVFQIMRAGFDRGSRTTGVAVGLMIAAVRELMTQDRVERAAQFGAEHADQGVVSFGMAGPESGSDHHRFKRASDIAREAGLLVVPHAGEMGGPKSVRAALRELRPDRIGHGVQAVEDSSVLEELVASGVTCDVCLHSNVALGVAPSVAEHQVAAMLAAGVPVTLNSDDQLFFGARVSDEYEAARRHLNLSDDQLAAIARTSARASGASRQLKDEILTGIDAWLARQAG